MWDDPGGWGNHNRLHRTEVYNYINGLVWLPHNQGSWSLYRWQDLRFTFNPRRNQNILLRAWTGVRLAKDRKNKGRRQQLVEFVFDGRLDVRIMRISIKVVILLAPRLYRWRWIHPSCIKKKKEKENGKVPSQKDFKTMESGFLTWLFRILYNCNLKRPYSYLLLS